jgi:hypothetical protein
VCICECVRVYVHVHMRINLRHLFAAESCIALNCATLLFNPQEAASNGSCLYFSSWRLLLCFGGPSHLLWRGGPSPGRRRDVKEPIPVSVHVCMCTYACIVHACVCTCVCVLCVCVVCCVCCVLCLCVCVCVCRGKREEMTLESEPCMPTQKST